jgi:hypothetical protein
MQKSTIFAAVTFVAMSAAPLTSQIVVEHGNGAEAVAAGTLPPQAGSRLLVQALTPGNLPVAEPQWRAAFDEELARAEVNRPRWVFPVAGAVLGGAAGLWYHFSTQSGSDFMVPIDPAYILGGLGAAAGGLIGWYVDSAQRQWIRTRPDPDEGSPRP